MESARRLRHEDRGRPADERGVGGGPTGRAAGGRAAHPVPGDGPSDWPEIERELEAVVKAAPDVATATRDVYLVFLEHYAQNVAAAVRAVADAPEGGVVIHCAGGKDRTGLVTAFLLHLAGVATEEIARDYALSEERLRARHDKWIEEAETEEERERLKRMAQTPADSIKGVFSELERRYGSVEGYLRHGGLTNDELARARARLRT